MSRLTSVKKKSLLKTSENSECNKENVNFESKSLEELDSPRMGELTKTFEKLTIDEKRPLRYRRTSMRSNEQQMDKTRNAREMRKSVNYKKSKVSSKADSSSKKEENAINQGKIPRNTAKMEHEKPQQSLSKKKEQKRSDAKSTSAESFPGIKDERSSSRKMSVNKVKPNNEFPTKTETPSQLLLSTNNKRLPAPIKPRPRTSTRHDNSPIPTASKINKDDLKAIKTAAASWKINKTELSSPSSTNDNVKTSQTSVPTKPRGNKQPAAEPDKIAKIATAVALIKREKPSPQSPIASVSVPPTTSTSILNVIDTNKYEKSTIDKRKASKNGPGGKQEDVMDKVLGPTSLNLDVMEKELQTNDGCSSVDSKLYQRGSKAKPQAKPQVNSVGKSKRDGSKKKARRHQRKDRKVALAFEKLAKRFVSTAKKMRYLDESKGNSSTDDSEDSEYSGDCSSSLHSSESSDADDSSEHSTECSCSSCTGTSSDYLTEYTVNTSLSTGDSDSSSSDTSSCSCSCSCSSSSSSSSSDTD